MNSSSILIIALSARPFVTAAKRAGYKVTAIDAFADQQTVELAEITIIVNYDEYGFNANDLLAAVNTLQLNQYIGFMYGSGFDAQPELLQQLAKIMPLIGNASETVSVVNSASGFFAALNELNILYPKIYDELPAADQNYKYLQKFAGGCGGTHIQFARNNTKLAPNHYYQQHVEGRSVSLLFIAKGEEIEVIGFNEQWHNPTKAKPFRYGGAVNHIELTESAQQQLLDAAKKLTIKFGLIGLNSLDAVIQYTDMQNDLVYVLEINPRLSATFDLYDDLEVNLLESHLQVCREKSRLKANFHEVSQAIKSSKAHAIVYATSDIQFSESPDWPDWVVDTPQLKTQFENINILESQPICSVVAHADQAGDAKQLAQTRVKIILENLEA